MILHINDARVESYTNLEDRVGRWFGWLLRRESLATLPASTAALSYTPQISFQEKAYPIELRSPQRHRGMLASQLYVF